MCWLPAAGTDRNYLYVYEERRKTSEIEYYTTRNIRQVMITLFVYGAETRRIY